MTTLPPRSNPAWAALPKKPCKNCGKKFKPTRPNADYCKVECKNAYNRHGGAFVKLKLALDREIKKRMSFEQACERCQPTRRKKRPAKDAPACTACRGRGKVLTEYGREALEAIRYYVVTPDYIVMRD